MSRDAGARRSRQKPSATARKVAFNILALGSKPGMDRVLPPGIVDATARLLLASGVVGSAAIRFARSRYAVAIYEAFDWLLPGQFEAFAQRKAVCESQVREALGEGATQVLVVGAGYDTLGWRLAAEFPAVAFFEIDHPATAERKIEGIGVLGPRPNLHLLAADLGERRLIDELAAHPAWDSAAPSVVVAEGLTPYLSSAAVHDLFRQCGRAVGVGSRIVFTHIASGDDGRPDVGRWTTLAMWMLRASGEPWLWSIRPEELPAFLAATGWSSETARLGARVRCGVEYFGVGVKRD